MGIDWAAHEETNFPALMQEVESIAPLEVRMLPCRELGLRVGGSDPSFTVRFCRPYLASPFL